MAGRYSNAVSDITSKQCMHMTITDRSSKYPVARTVLLARNRWILPSSRDRAMTPLHWPSSIIRSVAKYSM